MRNHYSLLLSVLLLWARLPRVNAQTTNATCQSQFDWMNNERGQSPCQVSAYLELPCLDDPDNAFVASLPDGWSYTPPEAPFLTVCECNTVIYSTMQACTACQGDPVQPWSTWAVNCPNPGISEYLAPVSSGTSIPAWAYMDVVTGDFFNVTSAKALTAKHIPDARASNATQSSSNAQPSSASSSASSMSSSGSQLSISPSGSTFPSSSSSSADSNNSNAPSENAASTAASMNRAAIAGGVVGGVVGISIIAAGAFVLVRRQRTRNAITQSPMTHDPSMGALLPAEKGPFASSPVFESPVPSVPQRLYDPDDPSTYPTAYADANSSVATSFAGNPAYSEYRPTSNYTGAPEV